MSTTHFTSFHPIDLTSNRIAAANIAQEEDVAAYAMDLVENVISATDQREYKFARNTTEVNQAVNQMVGHEDCADHAQTIANRLLQTEKNAQVQIARLGKKFRKAASFKS
jgi:PBP1b-binding outer membrane lipoprotein LpoB